VRSERRKVSDIYPAVTGTPKHAANMPLRDCTPRRIYCWGGLLPARFGVSYRGEHNESSEKTAYFLARRLAASLTMPQNVAKVLVDALSRIVEATILSLRGRLPHPKAMLKGGVTRRANRLPALKNCHVTAVGSDSRGFVALFHDLVE